MFGFRSKKTATRTTESVLAALTSTHAHMLGDGEQFVAAADAFGADQPHPEPRTSRANADKLMSDDERLSRAGAAHLRLAAVRTALGMTNEEFTDLPASPSGYVIAHTTKRLFIFDGSGERFLAEAPTNQLWLQPIEHGDGLQTLVFMSGDERVAVATRREASDMTVHFVATFPDRRAKARPLVIAGQPTIAAF